MLDHLLEGLTRDQKQQLSDLGITPARRCDWLKGRRHPTAAQILVLAMVTETDPQPLLLWLAQQEATPAQLDLFRRLKEAGTSAFLTLILGVVFFGPDASFAAYSSASPRNVLTPTEYTLSKFWRVLRRRLTARLARLQGPFGGLFFGLAKPMSKPC